MTRTKPPGALRIRSALLGGGLLLGTALLCGGATPCRAGDCGHCPPPYVHRTEQPPRIRFKCVCPKPVCPPCDEDFWGYYPTCWRRWPAPYPNCPEHYPAWLTVAPPCTPPGCPAQPCLFPPGGAQAPPFMPPANQHDAQPGNLGELPAQGELAPRPFREGAPNPVPMPIQGQLPSSTDSLAHTALPPAGSEAEEKEDAPVQLPTPRFRLDGIRPILPAPAEPAAQPGADPTP
jgi:hypothetical protein